VRLDHVIYVTRDAATTAARLRAEHGLVAIEGGHHTAHGTRNWVVPLPSPQYLELLEIGDAGAAANSPIGRLVLDRLAAGDGLLSWAVLVDDIDAVAARVGAEPVAGQISDAEGTVTGRWRTVAGGVDLPFFIQYDVDPVARAERQDRRYAEANHPAAPTGFAWIEVGGDETRMRDWLGNADLPIRFASAAPGPHAVAIATPGGEIVLR
jgi:hypothetical protein